MSAHTDLPARVFALLVRGIRQRFDFCALAVLASVLCPTSGRSAVALPTIISDHMVLQRDMAAPIWGTAAPGESIVVSIADQTRKTTADGGGKWRVDLTPMKVAEGLTLIVQGTNTLTIQDVMVGEVWLGSGQSNMDGGVRTFASRDEGLQAIVSAAPYSRIRLLNKGGKGWQLATAANIPSFSALLFAFGTHLERALNVPIGLVQGAVGGTPSGYWLTEAMLRENAAAQAQAREFAATYDFAAAVKKFEQVHAVWKKAEAEAKRTGGKVGREPVPPTRAGESNGRIGHLYEAHIRPHVPYAVRGVLWDQGESGTGITGIDQNHVMRALIAGWRAEWKQDFPFLYVQKLSGGGTAWDLANPTTRNALPFAALPGEVPASNDGVAREVHLKIQEHPGTAMVTSTDLGGSTHPLNKYGYGERAAQVALGAVYGRPVATSGPLYASHSIEGEKIRVEFAHAGRGLVARHSEQVQGFMIAGADRKFHWAKATIDGATVTVSSDSVPRPVAVRYAWSSNAPWANLFNRDGLPAQTFRTDTWK